MLNDEAMKERWVHVEQNFTASRDTVFDYLAEHENLAPLFGAKVTRVKDGDSERNGVNSVRLVKVGPAAPVEETVTEFVRPELIEYRVTHGGPLKNHVGIQKFSELPGNGCHLDYRIRISSNIPGVGFVLHKILTAGITKGLAGLNAKL
jgi:uncharacterized protein YndB with AHSA1/START domain